MTRRQHCSNVSIQVVHHSPRAVWFDGLVADGLRAEYERVIAELRSVVEVLRATVEQQAARIAVLEKAAGQDSSNSSRPPSSDGVGPRKKRAERRAEQRAAGRRPGEAARLAGCSFASSLSG